MVLVHHVYPFAFGIIESKGYADMIRIVHSTDLGDKMRIDVLAFAHSQQ